MHLPYPLLRPLLALMLMLMFNACVKTDPGLLNGVIPPINNPPTTGTGTPLITMVGTPVGNPVSKSIGPTGGTLISDDGLAELNIPAGALSSNTNISIQSVTNEIQGAIGLSYHLMPDGTKFAKPVSLIFHYQVEDITGTHPYLLYIAYQDSLNRWKADLVNRDVDTVAKTVTEEIKHFSIWTMGPALRISSDHIFDELRSKETAAITIYQQMESPPTAATGDDDDLPPLPVGTTLPAERVSNWTVNGKVGGNAQDGTITATGNPTIYQAPNDIPNKRVVQISGTYKDPLILFNHGRLIDHSEKYILFLDMTLLPSEFNFRVKMVTTDPQITGYTGQTYVDGASFDLSIINSGVNIGDGLTVIMTNIQNQAPSVTPEQYTVGYTTPPITFTWIKDGVGDMNVTAASAILSDENEATITLKHTGALAPHFSYVAATLTGELGGIAYEGYPSLFNIVLKDSIQQPYGKGPYGTVITVTPIR